MIAGRGATHAGGDIAVAQLQAVFCMGGGWLVGEAGAMKCGKKPILETLGFAQPLTPAIALKFGDVHNVTGY